MIKHKPWGETEREFLLRSLDEISAEQEKTLQILQQVKESNDSFTCELETIREREMDILFEIHNLVTNDNKRRGQ